MRTPLNRSNQGNVPTNAQMIEKQLAGQCTANLDPKGERTLSGAAAHLEEQTSQALALALNIQAGLYGGPGAPPRGEEPMASGLDDSIMRSQAQMSCVLDVLHDIHRRQ